MKINTKKKKSLQNAGKAVRKSGLQTNWVARHLKVLTAGGEGVVWGTPILQREARVPFLKKPRGKEAVLHVIKMKSRKDYTLRRVLFGEQKAQTRAL